MPFANTLVRWVNESAFAFIVQARPALPLADRFIVGVAPIDYGPVAESPRGISPRGAHRSGREPLDSSGSCHRMKGWRLSAKTSRFLPFLVDLSIPAPVTYPLPSTDITPL